MRARTSRTALLLGGTVLDRSWQRIGDELIEHYRWALPPVGTLARSDRPAVVDGAVVGAAYGSAEAAA